MRFFSKKAPSAPSQPATHYDNAVSWEASRIKQIEKSNKTAWRVSGVACALTVISWAAILAMLPLKERVPYLIRENATTGAVDVLSSLNSPNDVTFNDTRDKYWLSKYIERREQYDWFTLQSDYNFVGATSAPAVANEYATLFQGNNALDKVYRDKTHATVVINSVVPNGNGTGTVRFQKIIKRVDDPQGEGTTTNWVATIAYGYLNPSTMKESMRLTNPFAFMVNSYRVDPELSSQK